MVSKLALMMALLSQPEAVQSAPAQAAVPDAATSRAVGRADINPYDRDINLTVPLSFNNRVLGEITILLTRDDRFLINSEDFQKLLNPLLVDEARQELAALLAGKDMFSSGDVAGAGLELDYDPEQLAVELVQIDPMKRTVESLFEAMRQGEPGHPPEDFSAYLNTNLWVQRASSTGDVGAPSVNFNGAVRWKSLVLEGDFQGLEDTFSGDYSFRRNSLRLVYDQPKSYRRWMLGDLSPDVRAGQGYVDIGGVGVLRQTRSFEPFRNSSLSGNRRIVLREASTVRVVRNGVLLQEFRLDPGQYDLGNMPLDNGSNDINLEIEGATGRVEQVRYSAYLDMIDLDPGDYEYGAYLGYASPAFGNTKDYSSEDPVFTGYWRKAFLNRPALGLGLQANKDVVMASGQTQFILKNGARLQVNGSVSEHANNWGYAAGVIFDHVVSIWDTYDSWTVSADYTSEDFSYLNHSGLNSTSWVISGAYSRRFSAKWHANLSLSYRLSRRADQDAVLGASLMSSYRFSPMWSIQAGIDYTDYGASQFSSRNGIGFSFGLVWQPRFDRRFDSRYNSVNNTANASYRQYGSNRVGAVSYGVTTSYADGAGNVSGQVDYIGSRFDASLSHLAYGESFNSITDEQVTALRIGGSIATAGGKLALGRNIYDSFAIVYPHASLKGRDVVVGEGVENNIQVARSGRLGPALAYNLPSYTNQTLRYDVIDPPLGYNIGEGVMKLRPGYRSGYAIEVGSGRFVSAMGRLHGNQDRPVGLISGRVSALDDPGAEPSLFFTNSVGRFAIQDLAPGKTYRIELFSDPEVQIEFTVPEDNEGLLDLAILRVPLDVADSERD